MRAFESIVDEHFSFLCRDHGFTHGADSEPGKIVAYCLKDVKIYVYRDRGRLGVEIVNGGPPTIRQTDTYFVFDLSSFAHDHDPDDWSYNPRQFSSDRELTDHLEEEIAHAAKALRAYGMAVIEGRFDDWKGLRQRMREGYEQRR